MQGIRHRTKSTNSTRQHIHIRKVLRYPYGECYIFDELLISPPHPRSESMFSSSIHRHPQPLDSMPRPAVNQPRHHYHHNPSMHPSTIPLNKLTNNTFAQGPSHDTYIQTAYGPYRASSHLQSSVPSVPANSFLDDLRPRAYYVCCSQARNAGSFSQQGKARQGKGGTRKHVPQEKRKDPSSSNTRLSPLTQSHLGSRAEQSIKRQCNAMQSNIIITAPAIVIIHSSSN